MKLQFALFVILNFIQIGYQVNQRIPTGKLRIVGGDKVDAIQNYPFVAAIILSSGQTTIFHCGSVIFANHWVLTAGHCEKSWKIKEGITNGTLIIRANTTKWKHSGGDDHHVISSFIHNLYMKDMDYDYDVALLKVREPFRRESQINIVPDNFEYRKDLNVTVLGWGTDAQNGQGSEREDLHFTEIKIQDWEICKKHHRGKLTKRMFCAGDWGKDACKDDSGGPIFYHDKSNNRKFVIGIVSFGKDGMCAVSEYTGVYTNLAMTSNWVRKVVGNYSRAHRIDEEEDMEMDDIPYKLVD